ncbi:MAG TPA: hypothetical protein VFW96_23690 [Thermomicrobiales bacterium]|nr:hypothetical protein [Thermomicrobiales bacterium]
MSHQDEAAGAPGDALDETSLTAYLADEIARALAAHERAARGTAQRLLPLGEALALFNLADQFGLIGDVRARLDRGPGIDTYRAFSEAMKGALLDRGVPPSGSPRPGAPSRDHDREQNWRQGTANRPPRPQPGPPRHGGQRGGRGGHRGG